MRRSKPGYDEAKPLGRKSIAISATDHKQAALLCDRIIPLHSVDSVPTELVLGGFQDLIPVDNEFRRLLQADLNDKNELALRARKALEPWGLPVVSMDALTRSVGPRKPAARPFTKESIYRSITEIIIEIGAWHNLHLVLAVTRCVVAAGIHESLSAEGLSAVPVIPEFINSKKSKVVPPPGFRKGKVPFLDGKYDSVVLALSNIRLADTEHADWSQILEIRKDPVAKQKLRNLRLFVADSFAGKSPSYIEDSLGKRLDDYHSACKTHGLSLIQTTVKSIFDSKSALGLGVVTVAEILAGKKEIALFTGSLSGVLEISKGVLEITKGKHDLAHFKDSHELAYIIALRKALGAPQQRSSESNLGMGPYDLGSWIPQKAAPYSEKDQG